MAFLIPDNLKSRKDVPEAVRKIASAFQIGLDDRATLWFEPPFDPAGKKPHFVLLLPDRGIVVLEHLEVKSASDILGKLRGQIRVLRDGKESAVEDPMQRANAFGETLRQRIAAEARLAGVNVPVVCAAIFHLLTRQEAEQKGLQKGIDLDRCLFKPDLDQAIAGRGEANLERFFAKAFAGGAREPLPASARDLLRGVIQPDTVISRTSAEGPTAKTGGGTLVIFRKPQDQDEADLIRVMDREQEAMAKSLGDGHRVIRGVAGSGKTLVLVFRAKLLAELWPEDRILVTCYTHSLASQLRELLSDRPRIEVRNLDAIMSEFIKTAGLRHPGYKEDASGAQVATTAIQAQSRVKGQRYRAVLLDEAQDFGTDALKFALGLLQPGCEDFILVADSAQNIFRRSFSWKSVGIQAQGRTRILRVNYRNTKEILEFAHRFLTAGANLHVDEAPDPEDETAVIPPESAKRRGPQPSLQVCDSAEQEISNIVTQVRAWLTADSSPRSVAVLYATHGDGRPFKLRTALRQSGLDAFWLSDPQDRGARDRLNAAREPIVMSTIHSSKGLEFPRVVLFGEPKQELDPDSNRKLAYVAMTRAMQELSVVVSRSHPFLDDFVKSSTAAV